MSELHISDAIRYVGVDDTALDLFESQYPVPNGVSYNAYVILDEKAAVLDTVDRRFTAEWLEKLEKALAGRRPDYLVIHHLEPDHAGSIGALTERYPEMTLVASAKALAMLPKYFSCPNPTRAVAEGDTLSLGQHSLTFLMAPMVHWPEVMMSYETAEKTLFSADGFGTFGALGRHRPWLEEARRYYYNIVGKYGAQVQALLKKAAGLDIAAIAPLHGPVLREDLGFYLGKYDQWSRYEPEEKDAVLVARLHPRQHRPGRRHAGGDSGVPGRQGQDGGFVPLRPGGGGGRRLPLREGGVPLLHLRRRPLPPHGALPPPPAGQDLAEQDRGPGGERLLGPRRWKDHDRRLPGHEGRHPL